MSINLPPPPELDSPRLKDWLNQVRNILVGPSAGLFSSVTLYDGGTQSRYAGVVTEVNGKLIEFGVNDSSSNRFGGAYTSADQGGFVRVDSRATDLFTFFARAAGSTSAVNQVLAVTAKGNVVPGSAALATNATDGFTYIESCAGTPTGTPTAFTGRVPLVYDTTNNKLYAYNGAWKSVTLA